jgi:hypothetical protein
MTFKLLVEEKAATLWTGSWAFGLWYRIVDTNAYEEYNSYLYLQGTSKHGLITQKTAIWIIYTSTIEKSPEEILLIILFISE